MSTNHNLEKQVFRSHFVRLLDAKDVSFEEIVRIDRSRAKEVGSVWIPQESPQEALAQVPTRGQIAFALSLIHL